MGRQISLLLTSADLEAVEELLRKRGDVEFLSDELNEAHTSLIPIARLPFAPEEIGKVSLFCFLAPKDFHWRLKVDKHGETKFRVDTERSEVVDFWRPFWPGATMRKGRLYFTKSFFENGASQDKDPKFNKWAESVLSQVRRSLTRESVFQAYMGKDAARRIASGEMRIL